MAIGGRAFGTAIGLAVIACTSAFADTKFGTGARVTDIQPQGYRRLQVDFMIPDGHYLYADRISVEATGVKLTGQDVPAPKRYHDEIMGEELGIYDHDVSFTYQIEGDPDFPLKVSISYQGCSKQPMLCFLPTTDTISVSPPGEGNSGTAAEVAPPPAPTVDAPAAPWRELAKPYRLAGRAVGFLDSDAFLAFLGRAKSGEPVDADSLGIALQDRGLLVVLLAILLGGLALNLTPCVLPMIPINIAIIGAGAQAGSRGRGFALGAAYGAGIAVVYGSLGLVVALTGAKFGALNASPVFNIIIALLFAVMSLAMFGVLHIDLSRFQKAGGSARRGSFVTAAVLGSVAALLAGACVAPVVIAVLLLATDLQSRGIAAGLMLPFVLGIGMALPWPFAGAGLSFLPKPGKWMEKVKIVFGSIILLFALWYGKLGVSLLMDRMDTSRAEVAVAQEEAIRQLGWHTSLAAALEEGLQAGKPVLIDFWATWCKNCLHMEKTTFKDPAVLKGLEGYVKLKYQAENIGDAEISEVLDYFGAFGLPTYVVLSPPGAGESR